MMVGNDGQPLPTTSGWAANGEPMAENLAIFDGEKPGEPMDNNNGL